MPFGAGTRDLLQLVREAQRGSERPAPIAVSGPGAAELAVALTRGGDASAVVVDGDPRSCSALLLIVADEPSTAQGEVLRRVARSGAPAILIARGGVEPRHPHVLRTAVVEWPQSAPVPLDALAASLAASLGDAAAPLAATLPVLRDAVARRAVLETSVTAAGLAVVGRGPRQLMPILSLLQARMVRRVRTVAGEPPPAAPQEAVIAVAPELAAALATGLACRTIARRLPVGGRVVGGAIAFAGTAGLGAVVRRVSLRS